MKRIVLVMAVGALLIVLAAGVAVAKTFQCTSVPCEGTKRSDQITERKGTTRDVVEAKGAADFVDASLFTADEDRVFGGPGNDTIRANDADTRDFVDCGEGDYDVAVVDDTFSDNDPTFYADVTENCERVKFEFFPSEPT